MPVNSEKLESKSTINLALKKARRQQYAICVGQKSASSDSGDPT